MFVWLLGFVCIGAVGCAVVWLFGRSFVCVPVCLFDCFSVCVCGFVCVFVCFAPLFGCLLVVCVRVFLCVPVCVILFDGLFG